MKKIGLSIGFVIVVLVISLFQARRQEARVSDAFSKGKREGYEPALTLTKTADSLRDAMGREQLRFADSLVHRDQELGELRDSLTGEIYRRDSIIEQRLKQLAAAKKKPTSSKKSPEVTIKQVPEDTRHKAVLAYYKQRCDALPNDLTDYERRVAYAEVRSETARKFDISVAELNRLRATHNITY